jgi:peptide chain release factor 2
VSASKRSGGIFDVAGKQERVDELNEMSGDPDFWNDQKRSQAMLKEKATLERVVKLWSALHEAYEDAEAMRELADEAEDLETMEEATEMFRALLPQVDEAEIQQMLSEEADPMDAVLEVNSGAGGTDASDFAQMLLRMYRQWAEKMGFKFNVVDLQHHDEAGIKSAQVEVQGPYAYGYLKAEIGVHRLVRISPFDSAARRHTAFASVDVTPDLDEDFEVDVNESDCRIDTYRSSGAGGQHVNTTDSAVRITHLPTGIVAACQAERSQHKNKAKAWKMLKAKLYQHELEKRQAELDAANADKKKIEWGSQIRNYVLHPYRLVKDLRTGHESGNTDKVLDGELLPFMEAWLAQRTGQDDAEA